MILRFLLITGFLCHAMLAFASDDTFKQQIAPILERRCLSCHNNQDRAGEFSLETRGAAFADGYIDAGQSDDSHLIELITPSAGKAKMPKDSDPLTETEIAAIRAWIDAGAHWPDGLVLEPPKVTSFDWWSYQPLARPAVPEQDDAWVRAPIDAFVLQGLRARGLSPSPEADRRALIRRVTYDLIGLPPTPEEVAAFEQNADPQAYEKLVDRLLASEHYGERWARHWLDVVQYADTCGYDKDKLRPNAWPYRDYVIRAFNTDKPYSRFVQEQIAGDQLFPGTPDGILGLGFIAAGPWDFIGHVEVPESKLDGKVARNLDRDDMVCNTINTFCSLTVQCARCHNHKFDPITQEHYYGMQSLFAAVDRAERPYDLDPKVEQRRRELESEQKQLQTDLAAVEKEIRDAGGKQLADLDKEVAELRKQSTLKKTPEYGYHSAIVKQADTKKWVQVDLGESRDVARIVLHPCHDEYAGIGAGFGFPVRFRVEIQGAGAEWVTVLDKTQADVPNPGITPVEVEISNRSVRRIRVTGTRLVERKNDYMLALAEVEAIDADGKNVAQGGAVSSDDSIEAPVRWGRKNLTDGLWPHWQDAAAAKRLAEATSEQSKLLAKAETPGRVERRKAVQDSLGRVGEELKSLPSGRMVYAAATHFTPRGNFKPTNGTPRSVHMLHRGDIKHPREPAVPGILPLNAETSWQIDPQLTESERRVALARWLTRADHPLVWRSIVNRVWHYHFGQGIVATPNDFGRMGAVPTHPELLDWLAVEFRDGGQSFKKLHRLIVTSNTYRQSSRTNPRYEKIDGSNQYLWRMNRRRLEAEEIRDSILAVSGALDRTMGGPGFYLFALEKTDHSPHYEYHKFDPADPASHRRSVYRFVVRSQPDPWMTTLDCADSSQSTPKRTETLTSLQALSLLNNRFTLVMSERFAGRLEEEAGDLPARVERAFALVTQRQPNSDEREGLVNYARKHGLVNVTRVLLNLSEFVFVD